MLIKTKGIVLKTIKFQETSIIAKIYTESHGLLSFLINGVRSSKAKNKAALFQPLSILNLVVYYKDQKNLLRLKEYEHFKIYNSLPFDIVKSSIAQFLVEVMEHAIQEEEPNKALYTFLENSFLQLDKQEGNLANFNLHFLVTFMHYLGIMPINNFSNKNKLFSIPESCFAASENPTTLPIGNENLSKVLHHLLNNDTVKIDPAVRTNLLKVIIQYYQYHIDNFREIKSMTILQMVLQEK